MSELNVLTVQRDEVLAKVREIEETCEGIENENNAKKITSLNMKQANLSVQKNEIQVKLSLIERDLNIINEEIHNLSGTGIHKILKAIKNQRWFFFKNKPKVLMDKMTGILWANLDYLEWKKSPNENYTIEDVGRILKKLSIDGFTEWKLARFDDFKLMISDKTFPFHQGDRYYIKGERLWYCDMSGYNGTGLDLYDCSTSNWSNYILPCCYMLTDGAYSQNVSMDNKVYTETERLQFTLNLFVNNGLEPVFTENAITELYKKIYFEKPVLLQHLAQIQERINNLQQNVLLSSTFDHQPLLAKYKVKEIDSSIIKYYQAVISIIDEFMDKLRYYENVKSEVLRDFNVIGLKLSRKYEENPHLTESENELLSQRQTFLKKHLEIGLNNVNAQILAIKHQAESIEDRIEDINNGDNAVYELAILESEKRASFLFVVENIVTIIKRALCKIEFFEKNRRFVVNAVNLWGSWNEDYKTFKTKLKEDLKATCTEDSIEEEVYCSWYEDWQKKRFIIENQFVSIIARGLKNHLLADKENETTFAEQVLALLQIYKQGIDKFYIEERKNIYQKFAFQSGGDLQEKFETENELYKLTVSLQQKLQQIIFSIDDTEDRLFLLKWAEPLLDIQVDEILYFIKDKNLLKISEDVLIQFADLKRQNFEVYISDSKAYSDALQRREKEYNALVFKMRKDLMKA